MASHTSHSAAYSGLVAVADCTCVMASTALAAYATLPAGVDLFPYFAMHIGYFMVFILLWPVIASRHNLFVSRRRDYLGTLFFDTLQSVTITIVFTSFLIAFFTQLGMERAFVAWLGISTFLSIGGFRLILQLLLWSLRVRGFNKRFVLLIGANPRTRHLASIISGNPQYGYEIVGILEDEPDRTRMLEEFHLPNLGKFDALEQVLTRHVVDEVYIGLPVRSRYETIQSMAHLCEGAGVGVRMIADLFPLRLATSRFLKLQDLPILSLTTIPENQALIITQRVTDILVSVILLLKVSPRCIITAIA
ncbi:MAG: hypothetical protein IT368_12955, partial [Candidatus Hydrogenedentes bacterium]|nr:hypothetical protein [Candidatus Hydrogenedentota bacterium]